MNRREFIGIALAYTGAIALGVAGGIADKRESKGGRPSESAEETEPP